jgi:hypothetical protein
MMMLSQKCADLFLHAKPCILSCYLLAATPSVSPTVPQTVLPIGKWNVGSTMARSLKHFMAKASHGSTDC